jgi:hypothetical protein
MGITAAASICMSMGIDNDNCPACPLDRFCGSKPESYEEYVSNEAAKEAAAQKLIKEGFEV